MARDYGRERYRRLQHAQDGAVERLNTVYHYAYLGAWSFDRILAALAEWRETKDYKALTGPRREFVAGYHARIRAELYGGTAERYCGAWVWRLAYNGELVTDKEIPDGEWCNVRGGAHVWRHRPECIISVCDEAYSALYASHAYPAVEPIE